MTNSKRLFTIAEIKRTTSSVNGNPAYFITMTDGTRLRTSSDASWAYAVDSSMIGKKFMFTITPAGRIAYAKEV